MIPIGPESGPEIKRRGVPCGPEDLQDPGTLGRIAEILRRVHGGPAIPGTFSAFRTVEAYRQVALRSGVALPPALDGGLALARRVEAVLPPAPAVPCHHDLLAANFIDDGARLRLLDWEYAAMGDPFFDLGNVAANGELAPAEERRLVEAYAGAVSDASLTEFRARGKH